MVTTVKIILCVIAVIIVISVLMQKPTQPGGSGAMFGQSASSGNMGKIKGKTKEGRLSNVTKIMTAVFFVLTLALLFVSKVAEQ